MYKCGSWCLYLHLQVEPIQWMLYQFSQYYMITSALLFYLIMFYVGLKLLFSDSPYTYILNHNNTRHSEDLWFLFIESHVPLAQWRERGSLATGA